MSWQSEVYSLIAKNCSVGETFDLSILYQYHSYLQELYPKNKHITDKIRQSLQYLRDSGKIEFIDNNGLYRRLE